MKRRLAALVAILAVAGSARAVDDMSIGPYFGMTIPVANEQADPGTLWGIQLKVAPISWIALGVHFQQQAPGDAEEVFFAGTANEQAFKLDGGTINSIAADLYLGRQSGDPGINVFLAGTIGSYKWTRDNRADISELAWAAGVGAELVLPGGLGVEARGMFEVAPTDNDASIKDLAWFIGANYHFGLPGDQW